MNATGLTPATWNTKRVTRERLDQLARLMDEGGIDAVVEAIRREEQTTLVVPPPK